MADYVILHAPEDADRALGLVRALTGGLVLALPVDGSSGLTLGDHLVRVVVWSEAARPHAAALKAFAAGGRAMALKFDAAGIEPLGAIETIDALADAAATAALVQAAAGGRPRLRLSTTSGGLAQAPRAPVRARARDQRWRRVALAASAGVGVAAMSFATAVGYASYQQPLRVDAPDAKNSCQPATATAPGSVRAMLSPVNSLALGAGMPVIEPSAANDIELKVTARLQANRQSVEDQLARLDELQRLQVGSVRLAKVRPGAPSELTSAPMPDAPVTTLAELESLDGSQRLAELDAPVELEPAG